MIEVVSRFCPTIWSFAMSTSLFSVSRSFKRGVVSACLILAGVGTTVVSMPASAEVKVGVSDWTG